MPVGTQFKTSTIVLNESLLGFEDNFEFIGRVNHDYEEKDAQVAGMPTGGAISVRSNGIPTVQSGLTHTVQNIEQQFETITVNTSLMLGNTFSVNSVELLTDRNKITDTTHYNVSKSIAANANIGCYNELFLNTPIYIGSNSSTTIDNTTLVNLQTVTTELSIPQVDQTLYLNTRQYASIANSVTSINSFDQAQNVANNKFLLQEWYGIPLVRSQSLLSKKFTSFYPTGHALAFGVLTSTNSYLSAVITLTGATNGDTLAPGDRLTFATTKMLNPVTKTQTSVPLQLIVQNSVTAAGGGIFTGVQVVGGINALSGASTAANFYANVAAVPSTGEVVTVLGSYSVGFLVTKPGFTFATIQMEDFSTLPVPAWNKAGNQSTWSNMMQSRNPKNKTASINIRTAFDINLLTAAYLMRIDCQPVYKAFQRYNIAMISQIA